MSLAYLACLPQQTDSHFAKTLICLSASGDFRLHMWSQAFFFVETPVEYMVAESLKK